jgi:hypothetical protein
VLHDVDMEDVQPGGRCGQAVEGIRGPQAMDLVLAAVSAAAYRLQAEGAEVDGGQEPG